MRLLIKTCVALFLIGSLFSNAAQVRTGGGGGSAVTTNTGTTNYVAKYTSSTAINASSILYDNGTNIGIGSANPGQTLDVAGNIRTRGTNSLYFGDDNKASILASATTTPDIKFLTNSAEIMRITNGGNVGIATTVPGARLHIITNGALSNVSAIYDSDNIATASLTQYNLNGAVKGYFGFSNAFSAIGIFNSSALMKLVVLDGGNVGIGTTNPGTALDIVGNIRATGLTAGQALCAKTDKTIGQCTTVVSVGGACTCS